MTPDEAKDKMDKMAKNVSTFWLPEGFKISIQVPLEVANLTRIFFNKQTPFNDKAPFAAGEVFYYYGIRCYAS